jgi:hypothetical protein
MISNVCGTKLKVEGNNMINGEYNEERDPTVDWNKPIVWKPLASVIYAWQVLSLFHKDQEKYTELSDSVSY